MVENERKDDNTGDSGGKSPKKLRVLLRTFGCQMNIRDSEVISGILAKAGYSLTDEEGAADVIIFNTCSVRKHAEDKVWSAVGRICKSGVGSREEEGENIFDSSKLQTPNSKPLIGIVGCMANCYRQDIFERAPGVDFIVGTRDIGKIPEIIGRLLLSPQSTVHGPRLFQRKIYELDTEERSNEIYHTGFHLDREHAFVNISHGCENFCSYCVVPYTRGKLVHRMAEDIIAEIKENIAAGITKATLLGQNVNQWHGKLGVGSWELGVKSQEWGVDGKVYPSEPRTPISELSFPNLLRMVNDIPGLDEFSFLTSHPKDAGKELFEVMRDCAKLKKYLHLPLQSASNRILKLMNRGYTSEHYLDIIRLYRDIVKDGELSTDIIVGFPSETDVDFSDTLEAVKLIRFDKAYIFKYSPRPRTGALALADDVGVKEKERRHKVLLDLQKSISADIKISRA